jgi:hypothetical protein
MLSIGFHWGRFKIMPDAMETVKQSMASPMAKRMISK